MQLVCQQEDVSMFILVGLEILPVVMFQLVHFTFSLQLVQAFLSFTGISLCSVLLGIPNPTSFFLCFFFPSVFNFSSVLSFVAH